MKKVKEVTEEQEDRVEQLEGVIATTGEGDTEETFDAGEDLQFYGYIAELSYIASLFTGEPVN